MKARLAKLATDTNVNIKTNNLTYAATISRSCATVSPPRETTPDNNAGGGELSRRHHHPGTGEAGPLSLDGGADRLGAPYPRGMVAADPPRKETLATLARQAQVNLKTGILPMQPQTSIAAACHGGWPDRFRVLPPLQAPRPAPRQASPSITRHALPGWRRNRSRAMSTLPKPS